MWKLQLPAATYEGPQGQSLGRLDLRRPHQGLVDLMWREQALGIQPLEVHLPGAPSDREEQVADAYVRGTDLIATYEASGVRDVRPQLYWRDLAPSLELPLAIEVWISMQTQYLASEPATKMMTECRGWDVWCRPAGKGLEGESHRGESPEPLVPLRIEDGASHRWSLDEAPHLLLFRHDELLVSYAEMIYPSDCAGLTVEATGPQQVRWSYTMFPASLEKGVIRRARLRGFVLPRKDDATVAQRLFDAFLQTSPPLTA